MEQNIRDEKQNESVRKMTVQCLGENMRKFANKSKYMDEEFTK